MQSEEYKKGYRAGYYKGMNREWGMHLPPFPPDERVRELMEVAGDLRNKANVYCATLPVDNEMRADFEPLIDRIDDAFVKITKWMKEYDGSKVP